MPRNNKKHHNSPAHRRRNKAEANQDQQPKPTEPAAAAKPVQQRTPDRTPKHLIGDYGLPLQVSPAWVSHNSGKQLGLVPIPNRKEGWRMTHARYRPACSCWTQHMAGGEDCAHKDDSSHLWTLEAFIG